MTVLVGAPIWYGSPPTLIHEKKVSYMPGVEYKDMVLQEAFSGAYLLSSSLLTRFSFFMDIIEHFSISVGKLIRVLRSYCHVKFIFIKVISGRNPINHDWGPLILFICCTSSDINYSVVSTQPRALDN